MKALSMCWYDALPYQSILVVTLYPIKKGKACQKRLVYDTVLQYHDIILQSHTKL